MAYQRHVWNQGDRPTAGMFNNIEEGISAATAKGAAIANSIEGIDDRISQDVDELTALNSESWLVIGNRNVIIDQVEASQNVCFARGGNTASGTTFIGYEIGYQPYVNLFSADATGGLTCLVAGTFFVMANVFLKNTSAVLNLRKNGSTVEEIGRVQSNKSTPIGQRIMGFSLVTLAIGDVLSFAVSRSSSTVDTGEDLNFNLFKIA
jgi:hypothetical protein